MRTALLAISVILAHSAPALAQFQLDMTIGQVDRYLGVRTVTDLAVNEIGYLDSSQVKFCSEDERLLIYGHPELSDPLSYGYGYSVRRLAGDRVELEVKSAGDNTHLLRYIGSAMRSMVRKRNCDMARLQRPQALFFAVRTVNGYDTLAEMAADHLRNLAKADGAPPEWADDRYPDIDYTASAFIAGQFGLADIVGHWVVFEDTAEIDDSPRVLANTFGSSLSFGDNRLLLLQCVENQTRVIFQVDENLTADPRISRVRVDFRIDDGPARSERWGTSTTGTAAGLWGGDSVEMIRSMLGHESIYIRVADSRNRQHDETFDIRGVDDVAERVAAACGWSTLTLTRTDYMEIQQGLSRLGFYSGAIDGAWGPMSRAAMRAFQEANGLAVTGAPGRDSVNLLRE